MRKVYKYSSWDCVFLEIKSSVNIDHLLPECSLRHLSLVLLNYPRLADHWGAFGVEEQEGIRVLLEL